MKNIFESGELKKVLVPILEITTQYGAITEKQQKKLEGKWQQII